MSKKNILNVKIDAKELQDDVVQVTQKAELEAIIEAYKLKNPAKYAAKLASGEFDKKLAKL